MLSDRAESRAQAHYVSFTHAYEQFVVGLSVVGLIQSLNRLGD